MPAGGGRKGVKFLGRLAPRLALFWWSPEKGLERGLEQVWRLLLAWLGPWLGPTEDKRRKRASEQAAGGGKFRRFKRLGACWLGEGY